MKSNNFFLDKLYRHGSYPFMHDVKGVGQLVFIDVVGQLVVIDVNKKWFSLMSTSDVMGVFGEVSKVVPLWCSSKHGPHGKTL
jgi:hypothetical protein